MCTIPSALWISNAGARFSGIHGAVSMQARRVGCSRQAIYDHARKVSAAVEDQYSGNSPREQQLIREIEGPPQENAQLWEWVNRAVEFSVAIQQQFCAVAFAMGLSLQSNPRLVGRASETVPGRLAIHDWSLVPGRWCGGRQGPQTLGCLLQGFGTGRLSR